MSSVPLSRSTIFDAGPGEAPPVPETVAATGLSPEFIVDLLLKTLYVQGARTGQHLTDVVRLPFAFVDEQLMGLQQRRLAEVRSTAGATGPAKRWPRASTSVRPRCRWTSTAPGSSARASATST